MIVLDILDKSDIIMIWMSLQTGIYKWNFHHCDMKVIPNKLPK